jgi:sulfite oxidase
MQDILARYGKRSVRAVPDEALNAETAIGALGDAVTPVEDFFVRNNGALPAEADCEAGRWVLSIDGEVDNPRDFTLDELRAGFETVSVTAVMECAGNGRNEYDPPVEGLAWGRGAVGCAQWQGVRLRDVLARCGLRTSARYTAHYSPDRVIGGTGNAISRGLPIEKALAPHTLLAFAMNGAPLPFLHGAPLRIVAPGWPGSVWQKWLTRLTLRDRVHDGEKMNGTDYRLPVRALRPGEPFTDDDFAVIEAMPVNCLITAPVSGTVLADAGELVVTGRAWSGCGRVTRVEVSSDGGRSRHEADLTPAPERYAWSGFSARLSGLAGPRIEIIARAHDDTGSVQPLEPPWNPRGYCNNSAHRITVSVADRRV